MKNCPVRSLLWLIFFSNNLASVIYDQEIEELNLVHTHTDTHKKRERERERERDKVSDMNTLVDSL